MQKLDLDSEKISTSKPQCPFFLASIARAQALRPEYNGVRQGINKSREAIENCLSRVNGFSFNQMTDAIQALIDGGQYGEDETGKALKRLGYVDGMEVGLWP